MKRKSFNPSIFQSPNARSGLTLIETLVVIGIAAIISLVGFLGLSGYRAGQDVKNGLDELAAAVESARKRSMAQEEGSRWGVWFSNTTSSGSRYTVFKGASYASGTVDRTYSFRRNVQFSSPHVSSTYDALFAPSTGYLSEKKVVSLFGRAGDGFVGDLVMNTLGAITKRFESGVVGYWHLDENASTTVYDASGRGGVGALYSGSTACANPPTGGCPSWQSGSACKAGSCLSFNGTDNHVTSSFDGINVGASDLSVSVWVKLSTMPTINPRIVSFAQDANNGFSLVAYGGSGYDSFVWEIKKGGFFYGVGLSSALYAAGQWYHLGATFDNSANTPKLYMNGIVVSGGGGALTLPPTTGTLFIGSRANNSFFPGSIDEVRIYDRALTASEILAQYNDLK